MKDNITYTKIASAQISSTRTLVISKCSKGGYTIAQQFQAEEDGKPVSIYMKGAFHVNDINGLVDIRDAINMVLDSVAKR